MNGIAFSVIIVLYLCYTKTNNMKNYTLEIEERLNALLPHVNSCFNNHFSVKKQIEKLPKNYDHYLTSSFGFSVVGSVYKKFLITTFGYFELQKIVTINK
jgi:hypothetical protein